MLSNIKIDKIEAIKRLKEAGVVGAGGAGFPTYKKYEGEAKLLIINGAECEPLLGIDKVWLKYKANQILEGLVIAKELLGAEEVVVAFKRKYREITSIWENIIVGFPYIRLYLMDNFYPAGYEHILVKEITGKVVPPHGIPLLLGVVVNNVVTIANLGKAIKEGKSVFTRPLTITGAVREPKNLEVPVGTSIKDLIQWAGGVTVENFKFLIGGPVMGRVSDNLKEVITKTTSGVVVLPLEHPLIKFYERSPLHNKIFALNCEQCFYCTEMCPLWQMGYPLYPHRIIRAYAYEKADETIAGANLCCECGVCSLFACPIALDPRRVIKEFKKKINNIKSSMPTLPPSYFIPFSRIQADLLLQKLDLKNYAKPLEWDPKEYIPQRVSIPLSQHIGTPATPLVKVGEKVKAGQVIGKVAPDTLGAYIHSSIPGEVKSISSSFIEIERR